MTLNLSLASKRKWIWIVLFVFVVVLLTLLATSWNVVIVRDYQRVAELARSFRLSGVEPPAPWINLVLGTLGFAITLGGLILFFVRLLQEMRLNQLQSEFLATVSHALKTPIATMELSASLIRPGDLPIEESEKLWTSFFSDLSRLKEEVNTLLEATRWQTTQVKLHRVPIRLEEWVQDSMSHWKTILGPEARLERSGTPLIYEVLLDPKILALIADNLLDNARKFSRATPQVVIETRSFETEGFWKKRRWQIRVTDNGWGFDPNDAKRLFHRFFRARSEAPYAIPGTGLGLYLASSAGRALGLRLSAMSEGFGHGATFQIEGPVP